MVSHFIQKLNKCFFHAWEIPAYVELCLFSWQQLVEAHSESSFHRDKIADQVHRKLSLIPRRKAMKLFIVIVLMALSQPALSKYPFFPSFLEDQVDQANQDVDNDRPVLAKRSGVGHCYANGDPHYTTFDGKYYNFMGACRYVALTDSCKKPGQKVSLGNFKVIADNEKCGRFVSCIKSVEVIIGGEVVHLRRGTNSPATLHRPTYSVTVEGGYVVVRTKPAGLTVKWDKSMVLNIDLDQRYRGKVCGMCGNFDGNANNDFTMSSGGVTDDVNAFGQSWQAGGKCGKPVTPQHPCKKNSHRRAEAIKDCAVIKSDHFKTCKAAMDVTPLYNNCVYDVCEETTDTKKHISCESIKAASLICKGKTGKPVSWGHLQKKCLKVCAKQAMVFGQKLACCHFPFVFRGEHFYDCARDTSGGKPFCATGQIGSWRNMGDCI